MALTPRETQDMITLQRQVAWQYDLDNFTATELKKIQRSVNIARNDITAYFARRGDDIGAWTKERLDASLNELQAMTLGLQGEIADDISDLYAEAGSQAFAAQSNMLSFGGRVAGMNFVAIAPAQLKSMASDTAVGGQLLNDWVNKSMTTVMQEQLRAETLAGMLKGEGYPQFVKRLRNKFTQFSDTELTTLARTYVQEANVRAQTSIYKDNPDIVEQVQWSAVLEPGFVQTGRGTCPRCAALDGQQFDMDDHPLCPLHPRCRCVLLPVTVSYRALGLDIDEIQANYRPYTIRNNTNVDAGGKRKIIEVGFHKGDYGTWFNKQSQSFKRNVVGPNRLNLINEGKVTFNQLVSPSSGRLYTLDELDFFIEDGFPVNSASYAGMSKVEKNALVKRLMDMGPYPDLDTLTPLTGQEVKMLGSGVNVPTFGRTRVAISDDIVSYYQRRIVVPPVTPVEPVNLLPTTAVIKTQAQLDALSWPELRRFGSTLGIEGKHTRPEWNRLILEKVGDTPKLPPTPKVVPIPVPGPVDYKALSWTDLRAYGRELGVSGKYKRPELEDMIAATLKKGADPADVTVIVDKADNVVVANLTPQEKLTRQQKEFDEFFRLEDQKGRKQWKYPGTSLQEGSLSFADSAPAIAQHQRLLEARTNYMRSLKATEPKKWEEARKAVIRKQLKFTKNGAGVTITNDDLIDKLVNTTHRGTAHIEDGLFLEIDRGGLRIDWQMPYSTKRSNYRAFYRDGSNTIRVYFNADDFSVVAHEYGHAVDRWLTGRSSHWGSGTGMKWKDNMFVSREDGTKYRGFYNKQKTGGTGKFSNGDGNFDRGNWIKDYEGRIYGQGTQAEQYWAMGSQRFAKYDDLLRSNKWEQMSPQKQWEELVDVAVSKKSEASLLGNRAGVEKWQKALDHNVEQSIKKNVVAPPPRSKTEWIEWKSGWGKQKAFYPEFAEMQERIYRTPWSLKNDPMWKQVLKDEEVYNTKHGITTVAKADTAHIDDLLPEVPVAPVAKQRAAARKLPIDPEENYVRDGKVFKFKGEVVTGDVAERLEAMKLPPAWTDVVVDTNPNAKIQAVGVARNGKVQSRYSAEHVAAKAEEKFNRSRLFSSDLGTIRGKMEADILKGDPRAMLLKIEDETVIRIGTDADLGAKQKAYGLTTLQHEHVKVSGNKITFDFVAKEGIDAHYEITDARLADWLQERLDKTVPGEKLFPDVPAGKLNKYLKGLADGKTYSIKDYRTFHGTRIAFEELQQYAGQTFTDKERARIIKEVSTKASDFLHNNPAMAKKSYIDPMVWELIGGA